jgi:hypothetical protein
VSGKAAVDRRRCSTGQTAGWPRRSLTPILQKGLPTPSIP